MRGRKFVLVLALFGVLGCAAQVWWGRKTAILSLGMSKQQVQSLLGPPRDVMAQELSEMVVDTWMYLDRPVTFHITGR